jgi:hypothetical protein
MCGWCVWTERDVRFGVLNEGFQPVLHSRFEKCVPTQNCPSSLRGVLGKTSMFSTKPIGGAPSSQLRFLSHAKAGPGLFTLFEFPYFCGRKVGNTFTVETSPALYCLRNIRHDRIYRSTTDAVPIQSANVSDVYNIEGLLLAPFGQTSSHTKPLPTCKVLWFSAIAIHKFLLAPGVICNYSEMQILVLIPERFRGIDSPDLTRHALHLYWATIFSHEPCRDRIGTEECFIILS